jgi:hypothetical protein
MDSDDEVEHLVRRFEACTLPRAEWTHHAHLTVALWYLLHHPKVEATARIRDGIRRYNASQGNTTGYHETITLAWVEVVARFLDATGRAGSPTERAAELIGQCGGKGYLLRFYSRDRLLSDEARHHWVEPDLRPIE